MPLFIIPARPAVATLADAGVEPALVGPYHSRDEAALILRTVAAAAGIHPDDYHLVDKAVSYVIAPARPDVAPPLTVGFRAGPFDTWAGATIHLQDVAAARPHLHAHDYRVDMQFTDAPSEPAGSRS